jgi:phosphate transport system protein
VREGLQSELAVVGDLMVAAAAAVHQAMRTATVALLTTDAHVARSVVAGDGKINDLCARIEGRVYDTTARQAPVASDLRALFTALHIAADLERMGDLAKHVAKAALLGRFYERYADHAVNAGRQVVFLVTGQPVSGDPAQDPPKAERS